MKICCIYAYYEKNELYKSNFEYFLNHAILDHVDYYIVINDNSSIAIPEKHSNITVYYRQNFGYDFGAYCHGLNKIIKSYDFYFFCNTSVRGPYFLDDYIHQDKKDWVDYFIGLFNTDEIMIVGTTINIRNNKMYYQFDLSCLYGEKKVYSHVQTMFFCLKKDYFLYLNQINFFNEDELCDKNKNYIILYKEFGLSQLALNAGKNINCLLFKYRNLNYTTLTTDINPTSREGDPYFESAYFAESINPYQVIFFKNNRGL
jgi:hypothetical protein